VIAHSTISNRIHTLAQTGLKTYMERKVRVRGGYARIRARRASMLKLKIWKRLIARLRGPFGDEKGQALVIVGLGGVALVGFLSLVLDLGSVYFVRRSAQNAADSAALVGAQKWTGLAPNISLVTTAAVQDARSYAIKNGFNTNSGASNGVWHEEVRVDVPPVTGPYTGQPDYIEVNIRRQMNTLFASILGTDSVTVTARAVARSKQVSFDAATISLDPGTASTEVSGSTNIAVVGSTYSRGVTKNQSGSLVVTGNAYAKGGFAGSSITANAYITDVPDIYDPLWPAPAANPNPGISWNSNGVVERQTLDGDGYVWIDPGTYDFINVRAGDRAKFRPGVYKVTRNQGVNIAGIAVGTGPVCFVMSDTADFTVVAGAEANFYSSKTLYNGIVIWSSNTGTNAVKIAGGSNINFGGTIYAPRGTVRVAGTTGGTVHGQVFANYIKFNGNSGTAVVYDSTMAPDTPGPVLVE
jgi:hypothetical protein